MNFDAINNNSHLMSQLFEKVKELIEQKNYEVALSVVDSILVNENNITALSLKLSILGLMGNNDMAIEVANCAIEIEPNDHTLWFRRGIAQYYMGRYGEAIESFDYYLKLMPNFSRAVGKKISALIMLNKYREAVELFGISDLDENSYNILLNNIGYAYLELGDYENSEKILKEALAIDGRIIIINNLAKLYQRKGNYFKFLLLLIIARWKSFFGKDFVNNSEWQINKFIGPGKLFIVNSQVRETNAILKLFKNSHFWALCNDTFNWFAINIPFDLLGHNKISGDFDIIVSMPKTFPPDENTSPRYRSFEVKSVLVEKNGTVRSLKRGKNKKIHKQLKKLKDFGSEQIILLEIYGLERGYCNNYHFPTPEIDLEINNKVNLLKSDGFGYLIIQDEASEEMSDGHGGKFYFPYNILIAKPNVAKSPFLELVNHINNFYKSESVKIGLGGLRAVTYCRHCKQLILIDVHQERLECYHCHHCII